MEIFRILGLRVGVCLRGGLMDGVEILLRWANRETIILIGRPLRLRNWIQILTSDTARPSKIFEGVRIIIFPSDGLRVKGILVHHWGKFIGIVS